MIQAVEPEPNFCPCGLIIQADAVLCGVCKAEADGTFRAAVDRIRGKAYEGPSELHPARARDVTVERSKAERRSSARMKARRAGDGHRPNLFIVDPRKPR